MPTTQLTLTATLALAALLGASSGCARPAPSSPDRADAPHPRVVSITPSLTALVDGLGAGDHLVGVTTWCEHEGAPIIGDMRPDPERVAAARPDLVLAGRYPSIAGDLASLRARGHQVLDVPLDSLDDTRHAWRLIGQRLDAEAAAERLVADLDRALADARARAAARGYHPRLLLVFDVAGGYVVTTGGGDHLAEIVAAVGAVNVAAGGPLTTRLAMEQVLRLAPDVIVHTAPTDRFPDQASALAFWSHHPSLPAARAGRVHVWPDGRLATHGPGLLAAIRGLAAFADGPDR